MESWKKGEEVVARFWSKDKGRLSFVCSFAPSSSCRAFDLFLGRVELDGTALSFDRTRVS